MAAAAASQQSRTHCQRGCEHLPLPLPLAFARLTRLVPTLAPQQRPHRQDGLRRRGLPTLPPSSCDGSSEVGVVDASRCKPGLKALNRVRLLLRAAVRGVGARELRGRADEALAWPRVLLRRWGPLARCCRRRRCAACRHRRRRPRRCRRPRRRCATCRRQPAGFQAASESAARLA